MTDHYKDEAKHYVAVDCIIFGFDGDRLKLLLIKRNFEPGKGQWSLMGGFLKENEGLDEAAQRILEQLTGLRDIFLEQLLTYGEVNRDPAARVISVAYYALINTSNFDEFKAQNYKGSWFELTEMPDLIFDHVEMVNKARKRLRRKAKNQPIGFELLPQKFTLPQLMKLYEAIYDQKFDKRNFRKKLLSYNILKMLDEKDKKGSRKGAYLYQFDAEKYEQMISNGFSFEL
jgi:ADP-ribose pyrophosphatase YjhB (NUDIX family)